ncbi:MAG: cysteine desulfurase [Candidatus Kapabacteria bacterium]|nr:cysteine desulfurase [Candidatus Kapabacteria bacterium]
MIYADNAATTPVDPSVLRAMMPYFENVFYNATSSHVGGMMARHAVTQARNQIAGHLGANASDIIFTSGSTEAIAMAMLGLARADTEGRRHIVTAATEHSAVLDCCAYLEARGFTVTRLGVDPHGRIDIDEARAVITEATLLVSIMAVNNETGVVHDLRPFADIAHAKGAVMMTDATQAYGKIPIDVEAQGVDLLTMSGHKIYGPKGVGALYVRRDRIAGLEPLVYGGGQESGLRSGTLNVPGIVGLGAAGSAAHERMQEDHTRIADLRNRFEQAMTSLPGVSVNAADAVRSSTISNIMFEGIDVAALVGELPHVAMSAGSACHGAAGKASHVLQAMGRTAQQAIASLRFSFGRFTTDDEIDRLIDDIRRSHETLRSGVIAA